MEHLSGVTSVNELTAGVAHFIVSLILKNVYFFLSFYAYFISLQKAVEDSQMETLEQTKKTQRCLGSSVKSLLNIETDCAEIYQTQSVREKSLKDLVQVLMENINSQPSFSLVSRFLICY